MKEMLWDDIFITLAAQFAIADIRRYVLLKVGAWLLSVHVSMYGRRIFYTVFPTWKISYDIRFFILFFRLKKFSSPVNFYTIFPILKIISSSWFYIATYYFNNLFLILFFWFGKFSSTPDFWYYFSNDLDNFLRHLIFYANNFSDLKNFIWHWISNTVFPAWKIVSNIRFLILFFLGSTYTWLFFDIRNCVTSFMCVCSSCPLIEDTAYTCTSVHCILRHL